VCLLVPASEHDVIAAAAAQESGQLAAAMQQLHWGCQGPLLAALWCRLETQCLHAPPPRPKQCCCAHTQSHHERAYNIITQDHSRKQNEAAAGRRLATETRQMKSEARHVQTKWKQGHRQHHTVMHMFTASNASIGCSILDEVRPCRHTSHGPSYCRKSRHITEPCPRLAIRIRRKESTHSRSKEDAVGFANGTLVEFLHTCSDPGYARVAATGALQQTMLPPQMHTLSLTAPHARCRTMLNGKYCAGHGVQGPKQKPLGQSDMRTCAEQNFIRSRAGRAPVCCHPPP
jgi:hypothetical protein